MKLVSAIIFKILITEFSGHLQFTYYFLCLYAYHMLQYSILYCISVHISARIIIGSYRRPETKQGIGGKIDRFRSGRVRDRVRVRYN